MRMETRGTEGLHKTCIDRLRRLIEEANRTCELLNSISSFPIPLETWTKVVMQRVAENEAQAQYQIARERLFEALKPIARTESSGRSN